MIEGAQFRGGGTAIHVAPEVDAITDCDALRTAEETDKERESGDDEDSLRVGGSSLIDPFDKTAWLQRVCEKRADGSEFFCCCKHNFGDRLGMDEGKAKTWVVEPNTGKATPQKFHMYVLSCPSGIRKKISLL